MGKKKTGLAIRVAAFIAGVLLSLLCGLFYNLQKYEIERIEQEKGGWQSRISGVFRQEEITAIRNFAHVKNVVVNESRAGNGEVVLDLYFDSMGAVLEETLKIAEKLGISPGKFSYNDELLAMYLIRSPQDKAPRLVFPMFLLIMAMASGSLILIIHHSFAISMNNRIHQLGIFSSIGATPRQIRGYLLREAAALCAVPVLAGNLLGQALGMVFLHLSNVLLGNGIAGRHKAVFGCHPLVFGLTVFVTIITIGISAWIPAWKLSRLSPLEAIRNTGELQLKRRKNSRLLLLLFGIEGELAGNALKAQKKALRTAFLSFLLSFLAFTVMQCFFTMSEISTRETYFQRYQDAWDIMLAVKNIGVDAVEEIQKIQELRGVKSAVVYQKAMAKRRITEEELSEEMKASGGFSYASEDEVKKENGGWLVNAPLMILDDESFLDYCAQIGIAPRLDGAVLRNQICDITNPDFRHPVFMPYLKEGKDDKEEKNAVSVLLPSSGGMAVGKTMGEGNFMEREKNMQKAESGEIPILSFTTEVPFLREEYATFDYYELGHFIPATLWKTIKEQTGGKGSLPGTGRLE